MPVIQARVSRLRPVGVWFFAIVVFAGRVCPCLSAMNSDNFDLPSLRIENSDEVGPNWNIRGAWFSIDFAGFWGALEVQNVSPKAMEGSRFYAKYFDASGRACFTLIFSQDLNLEEKSGPFEPNEVRTLDFKTLFLSPAVEPKSVKFYVLNGQSMGRPGEVTPAQEHISTPPTLEGDSLWGKEWESVWLGSELKEAQGRILDLVLARLTLSSQAKVEHIEIVNKISDPLEPWFYSFLSHQKFKPATREDAPEQSAILLLVRAGLPAKEPIAELLPAFESPWVKRIIETSTDRVLPPVETILLTASPVDETNEFNALRFDILPVGTRWSSKETLADFVEQRQNHGEEQPIRSRPTLRRFP